MKVRCELIVALIATIVVTSTNAERKYGKRGHGCNVDDLPLILVAESCNCMNEDNPDCQLQFNRWKISCKNTVSEACLISVRNWAIAYSTASNANDLECKYGDPNYKLAQETWESCAIVE